MEDIANIEEEEEEKKDPGHLFKQLMASINPFATYVLDECRQAATKHQELTKSWTLEESIF